MTVQAPTSPDQRAFNDDIATAEFLAGVHRSQWRIVGVSWPTVTITIAAAARPGAPDVFSLRVDLTNYPMDAPTAAPWDLDADQPLAEGQRPKGELIGVVFRTDWEHGLALYAPYDRVALAGHPDWAIQHPLLVWTGHQDIAWWVRRVHGLLNDEDDYVGI